MDEITILCTYIKKIGLWYSFYEQFHRVQYFYFLKSNLGCSKYSDHHVCKYSYRNANARLSGHFTGLTCVCLSRAIRKSNSFPHASFPSFVFIKKKCCVFANSSYTRNMINYLNSKPSLSFSLIVWTALNGVPYTFACKRKKYLHLYLCLWKESN